MNLASSGQGDREVEGEDPDDGHGEQRGAQVGGGPDVTEPLANLSLGPHHARLGVEFGSAHERQGHDDGDIGGRVDEEAGRDAQSEDEDPTDGRADDPGRVHDDAVQAHRVGEEVETDHFGDKRLPGRIVEQVDHAEQAERAKTSPRSAEWVTTSRPSASASSPAEHCVA